MSASFDAFANAFATESWRRGAAGDDGNRAADRLAQRLCAGIDVIRGQRDDDLLDAVARGQGTDAQLENRSPADVEELLGPIGAEARASAACGDNGGNLHVRNEDCTLAHRSAKGEGGRREAVMKRTLIALSFAVLMHLLAFPAAAQDQAYSLESRAAIGAHHICSGLWVVGRVTKTIRRGDPRAGHRAVSRFQLGQALHLRR